MKLSEIEKQDLVNFLSVLMSRATVARCCHCSSVRAAVVGRTRSSAEQASDAAARQPPQLRRLSHRPRHEHAALLARRVRGRAVLPGLARQQRVGVLSAAARTRSADRRHGRGRPAHLRRPPARAGPRVGDAGAHAAPATPCSRPRPDSRRRRRRSRRRRSSRTARASSSSRTTSTATTSRCTRPASLSKRRAWRRRSMPRASTCADSEAPRSSRTGGRSIEARADRRECARRRWRENLVGLGLPADRVHVTWQSEPDAPDGVTDPGAPARDDHAEPTRCQARRRPPLTARGLRPRVSRRLRRAVPEGARRTRPVGAAAGREREVHRERHALSIGDGLWKTGRRLW